MRKGIYVTLLMLVSGYLLATSNSASASVENIWTSGGTLTSSSPRSRSENIYHWCTWQYASLYGQTGLQQVCLGRGKNIRLAYHGSTNRFYVAIGSDQTFYPIYSLDSNQQQTAILIPNTDTLILKDYGNFQHRGLSIYKNMPQRLSKLPLSSTYDFDASNPDFTLTPPNSPLQHIDMIGYSTNGNWLIAHSNIGTIRISTNDYSVRVIAEPNSQIGEYPYMAISDDGNHAVRLFGMYARAYDLTTSCGSSNLSQQLPQNQACPSADFTSLVSGYQTSSVWPGGVVFGDDARHFTVQYWDDSNANYKLVDIYSSSYVPPPPHDYLALGDSYSSGEGDTERMVTNTNYKWYRDFTDNDENSGMGIPREKCHISLRSYPYKLARFMELPRKNWDTVACSGATAHDIFPLGSDSVDYLGQPKGDKNKTPRLQGFGNAAELKVTALNEFIPGRNAQIEFVKKHKPKVITLTMGGNDIGFADKLDACANFRSIGTCEYAKGDYRQKLKNELKEMYVDLIILYKKLYDASGGQSKIYVLGYPQFISGAENALCESTLNLNTDERKMIYNSIEYFNNVIEQAAKRVGVKYIDIENALGNRKLCEDAGAYVTAITGVFGWNGNEMQESFHPNAKGHEAIANAVKVGLSNQSLLDYDWCLETEELICPDNAATQNTILTPANGYFEEGTATDSRLKKEQITATQIKKATPINLKLDSYLARPGSSMTATLYSDPVNLGDFDINTAGGIETSITIPSSVPAGYHTLILAGETYSGEPIEYYQSVLVTGSSPNDLDEDGIPDDQQLCGPFSVASGQDSDLDGIDDACDLEVSETPQLYRVRMGGPERTYGGQPEKEHYFYIERNTRASSITGISGDHDPDGDGWAIVGASQGKQYTATSVPDTGPTANFFVTGDGTPGDPYQPVVSLRAGGWGCATYRPTSLSKVTASQIRTLTRIATSIDTCRMEAPYGDVDGDGMADDQQALYAARNGDNAKREDPSRIYLYRNFHAAESQLAISDYTPTGTAANTIAALPLISTITNPPNHPIFGRALESIQDWNLLSVSRANEYIPQFNKLIILNSSHQDNPTDRPLPIILTKKQNGQCIAYQPANTDVIKFNQQNSLVKMATPPEGVGCE